VLYVGHYLGPLDALMARRDDILFIGFQERLDADFERLKTLLGLPAGLTLPSDPVVAHRRLDGQPTALDAQAVKNLETWYAEDIRLYEACRREFAVDGSPATPGP